MSGRLRSNDVDEDDKFIKGSDGTRIGNIGDNLKFTEILTGHVNTNLTVTTTAAEVKVGALPLTSRKLVVITNLGNQTVYYGDAAVSASNGQPLFKNQTVGIPCTEALPLYVRAATGTQDVRVTEYS